ncbi:hypothetical protein [Akkermansia massiliensis]
MRVILVHNVFRQVGCGFITLSTGKVEHFRFSSGVKDNSAAMIYGNFQSGGFLRSLMISARYDTVILPIAFARSRSSTSLPPLPRPLRFSLMYAPNSPAIAIPPFAVQQLRLLAHSHYTASNTACLEDWVKNSLNFL